VNSKVINHEMKNGKMKFHAELQHPRGAFLGQNSEAVITIQEGNTDANRVAGYHK